MGWGETWERGAEALIAGEVGNPIGPPPWPKSTENHGAGLRSVRYWQWVRKAKGHGYLEGSDIDLRDWFRRQREEGLFLREALGPVYDSAWVCSLLLAWHAARERLAQDPTDQVAQEIRAQALGAIRFALGLAGELRVSDGTVFAPGPRAKDLETAEHMERGLTVLAHFWSPVGRPHPDLQRHLNPGGRWLEQHGAARFMIHLFTSELREAIAMAGGPTLQGRLFHPLYWRRDGDTLDCWAPWLPVRNEDGGGHNRSGVWANFGWDARSRGDAMPVGWIKGGPLPPSGIANHPTRGDGDGPDALARIGWYHVGPDSTPWPLVAGGEEPIGHPTPEPAEPVLPPEEPSSPAPTIDPSTLTAKDWNALSGPDKRTALQAIFAVAEHDGPERIVRVRDRLAASIAAKRAEAG